MLILNVSLLTKSGMVLASKPRISDTNQEILAGGLMSAILSFSKEVHKKNIQSMIYHDRTTSFLELKDFFLVVEITNSIDTEIQEQVLSTIQKQLSTLIGDRNEYNLTSGEGDLILEEIISKASDIDYLGFEKPFINEAEGEFKINHRENDYEISFQRNCEDIVPEVSRMIDAGLRDLDNKFVGQNISGFIPFHKQGFAVFFITNSKRMKSHIGLLKVSKEKSLTLFRLTPLLEKQFRSNIEVQPDLPMDEQMGKLMNVYDTKSNKDSINKEYYSLKFLDKEIKNIEKAIYPLIVGDPVIVVGEKFSTKIVTHSLSIFSQHLNTEVVEWLTGEARIGQNITGVSTEVYSELVENNEIDDSITVVNLMRNKASGIESSSFFKSLFDKVKKKEIEGAYEVVGKELDKMVMLAISVTTFALLDKKEAKSKLKALSKEVNDEKKFAKVMKIAVKRNPLIKNMLEEFQSTLSAAEDYLSHF